MEEEMVKKKRRREGEEVKDSSNKSTKILQADLSHPHSVSNNTINIEGRSWKHEEDNNSSNNNYEISGDNCFALGVFDFPWLKEEGSSMISKAEEEWCLEDTIFSSSLHYSTTAPAEFSGQCLWETTPEATCIESCIDVPADKFEEINVWPLEMEGTVDCTWSALLQNKGD